MPQLSGTSRGRCKWGPKMNRIMVPTITRWNSRLYLGNGFDAVNVLMLQEKDITAVANLTNDNMGEKAYGSAYPFKTLVLGQLDGDLIPYVTIDRFLEWMDETWAEGHTIFVHCHAGLSRTPSFFIAWLMHRQGCTKETDLRTVWSKWEDQIGLRRPIIQPHHKLKSSVVDYFSLRVGAKHYFDDGLKPDVGVFSRQQELEEIENG